MPALEVALLAVALAVDAFGVGAAVGVRHRSARQRFRLSYHFGLFQALMPLAGVAAGAALEKIVRDFDHWIAFGLLAFVGVRMIRGALRDEDRTEARDLTRGWSLIVLSAAVSIDALAVGVTFGLTGVDFWVPILVIGVVAAAATLAGMLLAGRFGRSLGKRAEFAAGLVLIGIGAKILFEHLGVL